MLTTLIVVSIFVPEVRIPVMVIAPEEVETIVLVPTPEMGRLVAAVADLSTWGPSRSPSFTKMGRMIVCSLLLNKVLSNRLALRKL